jgi:hypothetical protein
MVAAMFSDVAILHGFFVWPKLIAAFLLAAGDRDLAGLEPRPPGGADRRPAGALDAFPRIEHLRRRPAGPAGGVARPAEPALDRAGVVALLALMLPRSAYQHYADSPATGC